MENRIETLRKIIEQKLLSKNEEIKYRFNYLCHMNAVSQFCSLIALKRNENAELATMAGLLHDYYTYTTLDAANHAEKGAVLARKLLNEINLTTKSETDLICSAIHNHSLKNQLHSSFDEVLIDADVLQHVLFNVTLPIFEWEKKRFENLASEFGFQL